MSTAAFTIAAALMIAAGPAISAPASGNTEWGGGFFTGVDSVATSRANAVTGDAGQGASKDPALAEATVRCAGLAAFARPNVSSKRFARIPDAPTQVMQAETAPAAGWTKAART
jgi:hypothetical protein